MNIALMCIMHPNKKTGTDSHSRITDSAAFPQLARSVLWLIPNPEDMTERRLIQTKPQYVQPGSALGRVFRVDSVDVAFEGGRVIPYPKLAFVEERSDLSDEDVSKALDAEGDKGKGPRIDTGRLLCKDWLRGLLMKRGEMDVSEILAEGEKAGFAESTIRTKAKGLVNSTHIGKCARWSLLTQQSEEKP
jgi:hypothetical protein